MVELADTLWSTAGLLATAIGCALLSALIGAIVIGPFERSDRGFFKTAGRVFIILAAYGIPIAVLAYVAGYLTVYSRTSAVGNVLPAVLALVGGANIYVFGTDSSKRGIVGYCVVLFAWIILYGTQSGAQLRENERVGRLHDLAVQELQVRTFRQNLGLNAEPPAWILSTEPK